MSQTKKDTLGVTRNLTEVFTLLRSNAQQTKCVYNDDPNVSIRTAREDERMSLVQLEDAVGENSSTQPFWLHTADEVEFEFERVRSKMEELAAKQQKHISRPNLGDELFEKEEKQMEATTEQITQMLTHCQRLIKMMTTQVTKRERPTETILRENSSKSLSFTLSQLTDKFRSSQFKYLNSIKNRTRKIDDFVVAGHSDDGPQWGELIDVSSGKEEYSMTQLHQMMENDQTVRERETEILAVNSSIRELNTLFKDLSTMVCDQGTILDRIDFYVEQSSIRVSKAVNDVSKAERAQRGDKKMHCICLLTVAIIFVLILLIATKF